MIIVTTMCKLLLAMLLLVLVEHLCLGRADGVLALLGGELGAGGGGG